MTSSLLSVYDAIDLLKKENIIAYPTESIYGLGCDPDSAKAVTSLLKLKQRPIDKGLILIADNYDQLLPYINDSQLSKKQKTSIFASWPGPITWLFPRNEHTPNYLTGKFNSIAVRITDHPIIKTLCSLFGKPIVSTSANLSGKAPCRSPEDVLLQFGNPFPILNGSLGDQVKPSQIRDSLTGKIIRN